MGLIPFKKEFPSLHQLRILSANYVKAVIITVLVLKCKTTVQLADSIVTNDTKVKEIQ